MQKKKCFENQWPCWSVSSFHTFRQLEQDINRCILTQSNYYHGFISCPTRAQWLIHMSWEGMLKDYEENLTFRLVIPFHSLKICQGQIKLSPQFSVHRNRKDSVTKHFSWINGQLMLKAAPEVTALSQYWSPGNTLHLHNYCLILRTHCPRK